MTKQEKLKIQDEWIDNQEWIGRIELVKEYRNSLQELAKLKENLENLEIDGSDYEDDYDEFLDECNEHVFGLLPSRILQECDPIMYNCGLADYVDGIDIEETEKYRELSVEIENLESDIDDFKEGKLSEILEDIKGLPDCEKVTGIARHSAQVILEILLDIGDNEEIVC